MNQTAEQPSAILASIAEKPYAEQARSLPDGMFMDDLFRFIRAIRIDLESGCWVWSSALIKGYPGFKMGGKMIKGHRLSYLIFRGEFDRSLLVCHTCDNPKCVNPDHLFLGTPLDNNRDRIKKGRSRHLLGKFNPGAKLTDAQVVEIRSISNLTHRQIAARFGLSQTSVSLIRTRKTWKHLP